MSCHDATEEKKWICEYCTYENWLMTLKCTMCRAPKPPQFIAEEASRQNIYKLQDDSSTPLICPSGGQTQTLSPTSQTGSRASSAAVAGPMGKWVCHACTYLNWPRAIRCTQCLSPRRHMSPVAAKNLHDYLQPLHISVSDPSTPSKPSSCKGSPNSPDAIRDVREAHNDRNRTLAKIQTQSQVVKWTCGACTYENWPRATRCTLCKKPRNKIVCETIGSQENSPEKEDGGRDHGTFSQDDNRRGILDNRLSQNNRSRPSAVCSEQLEHLVGATAVSNNYEYEKRLRQLRRRMREADWPWLNACLGVVEGDPNPVEAYLSAGGDATRQLTQNEVMLLNRASAFDVGHTLVHLAIRFHREDLLATLLSQIEGGGSGVKRVPSYVAPDLAADIRRNVAAALRQRKGSFPCYFITDLTTFALPAGGGLLSADLCEI